jgi:hypothetical protein
VTRPWRCATTAAASAGGGKGGRSPSSQRGGSPRSSCRPRAMVWPLSDGGGAAVAAPSSARRGDARDGDAAWLLAAAGRRRQQQLRWRRRRSCRSGGDGIAAATDAGHGVADLPGGRVHGPRETEHRPVASQPPRRGAPSSSSRLVERACDALRDLPRLLHLLPHRGLGKLRLACILACPSRRRLPAPTHHTYHPRPQQS